MGPDPTGRPALHPGRPAGERQRSLLLALVEADPGIHITRATHLLALNWNTCFHHARRLAIEGRLVIRKVRGRLCLFDPSEGAVDRRIAPILLRDARTADLVAAILAHPGTIQKELARRIGVAPSVVHRHVLRLERAGLVRRAPRPRGLAVYATEWLAETGGAGAAEPTAFLVPVGPAPS